MRGVTLLSTALWLSACHWSAFGVLPDPQGPTATTEIADGLAWCNGVGPEALLETDLRPPSGPGADDLIDPSPFKRCTPIIRDTIDDDFTHGSYWFELSTNAEGHVTSLCLVKGSLANRTPYLACIVETLKAFDPVLVPSKTLPWKLTFLY